MASVAVYLQIKSVIVNPELVWLPLNYYRGLWEQNIMIGNLHRHNTWGLLMQLNCTGLKGIIYLIYKINGNVS